MRLEKMTLRVDVDKEEKLSEDQAWEHIRSLANMED
jgi:hypothetical protein